MAVLDMAAELGALTPKLAALPGTTARSTIANLLSALVGEARTAFQTFEGSVGRDLSKSQGGAVFVILFASFVPLLALLSHMKVCKWPGECQILPANDRTDILQAAYQLKHNHDQALNIAAKACSVLASA